MRIIEADPIYTNSLINKAKNKQCIVCDQEITSQEAENKQFIYSKTKRGTEVFSHIKHFTGRNLSE